MKKKTVLYWILRRTSKRIPALILMTGAQIGYSLFLILFALGFSSVIDNAVSGSTEAFRTACFIQMGIIAGGMLCYCLMRNLHDKLRADLDRDWKKRLLNGLLHGEYEDVRKYHTAELLNRMNNDVSRVNEGVLTVVPSAVSLLTRLTAAMFVLGRMDIQFMLCVTVFGGIMLIVTGLLRQRLKELNKKVSTHDGRVSAFLQEIMEKLLMVQALDVSHEVEKRSDVLLEERYKMQRRRKNISLLANTGMNLIYYSTSFFVLIWCGLRLIEGSMSFGSVMAIIQLVNQLQTPFVNLSGILPKYVEMRASAERLMELEEIQGTYVERKNADSLYARMHELRAEKLSFSYDRDVILREADFAIPKGAFAVITGSSGIGKSTLLKLLLGIYRPNSGTLTIQGEDQNLSVNRDTRGLFAYVPQGNLLLSGTLRENLLIANPDATETDISAALYISTMDEFVANFPQGLDTLLGEDGLGLSEGQAQRLAIARAVVSNAPILLLDECTSALDETTEVKVLTRLKALPDKTCIAVTHRTAAVALSTWHLKVQDGKVSAIHAAGC